MTPFFSMPIDVALLLVRLSLGATFLAHGYMKRGMWKVQPSAQTPAGMVYMMRFLSIVEPLGALGVLFGVLTWWAALGLAVIMIGATVMKITMWKVPFASNEKMGWECDVALFTMCLVLLALGAGSYAL